MNLDDIYTALDSAGVRLHIEHGTLYAGPRSALSPELAQLIREHKKALLAELRMIEFWGSTPWAHGEPWATSENWFRCQGSKKESEQ